MHFFTVKMHFDPVNEKVKPHISLTLQTKHPTNGAFCLMNK